MTLRCDEIVMEVLGGTEEDYQAAISLCLEAVQRNLYGEELDEFYKWWDKNPARDENKN